MTERGKYASHGVFIKRIDQNFVGNWGKPKNAVINPIHSTVPRQKGQNTYPNDMLVASKTFNAKCKFQQLQPQKPVPQDLIQPFLYIEKVIRKRKVYEDDHKSTKNEENINKSKKRQDDKKSKPFIIPRNNKSVAVPQTSKIKAPLGFNNLFQFEVDKKSTANLIFQKMLDADIQNPKQLFHLWNKNAHRNLGDDINIQSQQFLNFLKELIPNKITTATIKHFFQIYKSNKIIQKKDGKEQDKAHTDSGFISIRAFSYNYEKYRKAQSQIVNIMSDKAAKSRYENIKRYITNFLTHYPELKVGMQGMKEYQETLKRHFIRLYEQYKNPFKEEINRLQKELQKPIIKYDKAKKEKLENQIIEYEKENSIVYSKLTDDFQNFINAYESAIVKNHDLLFTNRTVAHLLNPIIEVEPLLTRDLIQVQVENRQAQKQKYLQCLSDIVVEVESDKKNLQQDCFTLGEIAQLVKMRFRHKRTKEESEMQEFSITCLKKLIKEIKRQYLVKFNLSVQNLDNFPADQQIPLEILHTCFEMQCTKVLFKNRIWSELLEMLPLRTIQYKLHQKAIDANTCMEYINKYFKKLDERMSIERIKSKQISLLVENAYTHNFGRYAEIVNQVVYGLDNFIEGIPEQQPPQQQQNRKKKRVGFADVVDAKLAIDRGQVNVLAPTEDEKLINDIIKMINNQARGVGESLISSLIKGNKEAVHDQGTQSPMKALDTLGMFKSMAKSYFQPQAINTNVFDIRYYEKFAEEQKANRHPEEIGVQLGSSMILSGAPLPDQIEGSSDDPLRISRFLLKTIDKDVQQQQKKLTNKSYERDINEGIQNNYFKEKIILQNKPTRYDSEGKSKYSVILPMGYYESYIVGQSVPDTQKWYLRAHHVETLTQNPLSKKDNVIHTEYQSKLEKLSLKKRPDEFVIEENVKRKDGLISELEQRIASLKNEVHNTRRQSDIPGFKVKTSMVNEYYSNITQGKQDKDLEKAAYEGVLYDLRRKERQILNKCRQNETKQHGEANTKWWERKDKDFNRQARKDRKIQADDTGKHRIYVEKLKNNEVY